MMVRPGDVYSYYIEELEQYGAYQVIEVCEDSCLYLPLDYCRSEPPAPEQLAGIGPLRNEMWRNHGAPFIGWIDCIEAPDDYVLVCNREPVTGRTTGPYCGNRWSRGREYIEVSGWNEIPAAVRALYKQYVTSGDFIRIGAAQIRLSANRVTDELLEQLSAIDDLDRLPCLTCVRCRDVNRELLAYLGSRPMIRAAELTAVSTQAVDFSGTWLRDITMNVTGVKAIILSAQTTTLRLEGTIDPDLTITARDNGRFLHLMVTMKNNPFSGFSLDGLKSLYIKDIYEVDVDRLCNCYPALKRLYLRGAPGLASGMGSLRQLTRLRELILGDIFGYDETQLRELDKLEHLKIIDADSIPEAAGKYLRRRYKGRLEFFCAAKLRKDGWLADNLDNPFRHWDGNEFIPQKAYEKVRPAYKKFRTALCSCQDDAQLTACLEQYIAVFNKLNKQYDEFIESEERDDIFRSVLDLYQKELEPRGIMAQNSVERLIDELRDNW